MSEITALGIITLDEAKKHLRVDYDADDAVITTLISAVIQFAEYYQNRIYIGDTTAETNPAEAMPEMEKAACLLLLGHLYEHRSAVNIDRLKDSATEVPLGVRALLDKRRLIPV